MFLDKKYDLKKYNFSSLPFNQLSVSHNQPSIQIANNSILRFSFIYSGLISELTNKYKLQCPLKTKLLILIGSYSERNMGNLTAYRLSKLLGYKSPVLIYKRLFELTLEGYLRKETYRHTHFNKLSYQYYIRVKGQLFFDEYAGILRHYLVSA